MVQAVRPLGPAVKEVMGPTAKGALCPLEAHAPPMAKGDVASCDWSVISSLSSFIFPSSLSIWFSRRKKLIFPSVFSSEFSHLPNIISPSSGVGFEWFKLENVRNWVHRFFWWFHTEIRTNCWIKGIGLIFGISFFLTFNLLRVSSSISMFMFGKSYWER